MLEHRSEETFENMSTETDIQKEIASNISQKESKSMKGSNKNQNVETEELIKEALMEPNPKMVEESFSSLEHNFVTPEYPSPVPNQKSKDEHSDEKIFTDLQETVLASPETENGEICARIDGNEETREVPTPVVATASTHRQESTGGQKKECLFKIIVIGELGSGKTSFIKRYVHQFFSQHYRATIGVDFALKVINWDPNTTVRLQLWDIAGQERFGNMTRVYYKEAVGAFIVFDVTRVGTFDAVTKWKHDLDAKVQLPDGRPIPCILLANKCDQAKEGPINVPGKLKEFCEEHKFATYYETSAKDNINVDEAAKHLVELILRNDKFCNNGNVEQDPERLRLDSANNAENQKRGCNTC